MFSPQHYMILDCRLTNLSCPPLQFDALVTALPLSEGGEEAQLRRIAELQV